MGAPFWELFYGSSHMGAPVWELPYGSSHTGAPIWELLYGSSHMESSRWEIPYGSSHALPALYAMLTPYALQPLRINLDASRVLNRPDYIINVRV